MNIPIKCRERRIYFMNAKDSKDTEDSNTSGKLFKHPLVMQILSNVISSVIISLIGIFFGLVVGYNVLNTKVEGIESKLANLETIDQSIQRLKRRLDTVEEVLDIKDDSNNSSIPDDNHSGNNNDKGGNSNSGLEVHFLSLIVPYPFNEEVITNSWSEISAFENSSGSIGTMRVQDPVAYNYDTQEEYTYVA